MELREYLLGYLTERRRNLFDQVLAERTRHLTVVTEDMYQLHNTSAVLRSCDVFGIQDLHVIEERFGRKMDREIAMGAQKWVSVIRHQNTAECMTNLRKQGYQIVATTPHEKAFPLSQFDIKQKSALCFGTEKEGLSPEILKEADTCIYIPMYGFTESLNVSVAAAIILQELVQRLRSEGVNWPLTSEEKSALKLEWTKKSIKGVDAIIQRFLDDKNS